MRVLQHTPDLLVLRPTRAGLWLAVGGAIFAAVGLVLSFFLGRTMALDCRRVESKAIDCILEKRLLGLSVGSEPIEDLRGARLDRRRDSEGDLVYRITLLSDDGERPLRKTWSSGASGKSQFVDRVNAFVEDREQVEQQIELGGASGLLFGAIFFLIGIVMAFLGARTMQMTWIFDRAAGVMVRQVGGVLGRRATEYPLQDVRGVWVEGSQSSSGSQPSYRPVIALASGEQVPMLSFYSSGRRDKEKTAAAIREFLALNQEGVSGSEWMGLGTDYAGDGKGS